MRDIWKIKSWTLQYYTALYQAHVLLYMQQNRTHFIKRFTHVIMVSTCFTANDFVIGLTKDSECDNKVSFAVEDLLTL